MPDRRFEERYECSRALIVGINAYRRARELSHCVNDANAIENILRTRFGFAREHMAVLLDDEATRDNIRNAYFAFSDESVSSDDRVVVFFAGHGHTVPTMRGEAGFLVPVDGDLEDVASLIRWQDLTVNADLIPAKHIFFIMDACYGGLALTRSPIVGRTRFLKDMLRRRSRQVLTAGKADQPVLDAGGPRSGHSIFTGHLLEGLEGAAATTDGTITANCVIAYVYERVGLDSSSIQTPHFSQIDGDGDFVFHSPVLRLEASAQEANDEEAGDTDEGIGTDLLVQVPFFHNAQVETPATVADQIKEYLSEPRFRIKLDDLVTMQLRAILEATSTSHFPVQGTAGSKEQLTEELIGRLDAFEKATSDLQMTGALIAHWGAIEQTYLLGKMSARLAEAIKTEGGLVVWLGLRCYPLMLVIYASGIAAIAAEQYGALRALFETRVSPSSTYEEEQRVVSLLVRQISELGRTETFKLLPGHERHYAPRSEYLHKLLQPALDDALFLGQAYEACFDRFEMLFALAHVDSALQSDGVSWAPFGRFAWKHHGRTSDSSPYAALLAEAKAAGDSWRPVSDGMFGGSLDRFVEAWEAYLERLNRLQWF